MLTSEFKDIDYNMWGAHGSEKDKIEEYVYTGNKSDLVGGRVKSLRVMMPEYSVEK